MEIKQIENFSIYHFQNPKSNGHTSPYRIVFPNAVRIEMRRFILTLIFNVDTISCSIMACKGHG